MAQPFNEADCRRFLQFILAPELGCAELRIFKATINKSWIEGADQYSRTLGGWFTDIDKLVIDLQRIRGVSGFITINPVKRDLLSRIDHRVAKIERGAGTSDNQIVCLRIMFLDFDAERDADISATDEELAKALAVRDKFLEEHPEVAASSIWGCSGNGGWITVLLPCYPNDEHHNALVKQGIVSISQEYSVPGVKVDTKTSNASRVMGIAGLLKAKGSNRPERPWRPATIDSPLDHSPTPFDLAAWLLNRPAIVEPVATQRGLARSPRAHTALAHAWVASDPRTIRRITSFMAAVPPAISGQGGHDQLFSAATALVKGFGLATEEAWGYLADYNQTCLPPWNESDLRHKLEDADSKPDDKPRGYLLESDTSGLPAAAPFDLSSLGGNRLAIAYGEGGNGHVNGNGHHPVEVLPADDFKIPVSIETPHGLAASIVILYFTGPSGETIHYWQGEFHEWSGSFYRPIPKDDMNMIVNNHIQHIHVADFKANMRLYQSARAAGNDKVKMPKLRPVTRGLVADVIQALGSSTLLKSIELPHQPAWIDGEGPWPANEVLPTKDALVHLPSLISGEPASIPPTPQFFGRYALSYGYDPDAPEPSLWLSFLRELWPEDDGSIQLLCEWMGYLLTPDTSQQKIAMLLGPPRSGKGTIVRIITALMGAENVVYPTFSSLSTNFGLAPLIGKPAAIISDARVSTKTDTAVVIERLLSISGQDDQTIDRKNQAAWTGRLPCRFIIATNELPNFKDASGALSSRVLILQLKESFLDKEDLDLTTKLLPELSGILKWAVSGWASLRERGKFLEPKSSKDTKQSLQDSSSQIKAFLRDRCYTADPKACVNVQTIFAAWRTWCAEKGKDHPGIEDVFGKDLRAAFPKTTKIRPRIEGGGRAYAYSGIRMLTEGEMNVADDDNRPEDDDYVLPAF